jgi:hypothetical protein
MKKMSKVFVQVMVPAIEKEYELWIPANKRIYNAIYYIVKAINEFTNGSYNPKKIQRRNKLQFRDII